MFPRVAWVVCRLGRLGYAESLKLFAFGKTTPWDFKAGMKIRGFSPKMRLA